MVSPIRDEGCGGDGGAEGESVSYASLNEFEVSASAAWLAVLYLNRYRA
jgi:hypothetical protein